MELKHLVLFMLFALVAADTDSETCGQEKTAPCMQKLIETTMSGSVDEEKMCSVMRETTVCLRSAADECLGPERDPKIDESLEEMESVIKQNCPSGDNDADMDPEIRQCLEENQQYIMYCAYKGITDATEQFGALDEMPNEDVLKCGMYSMMSSCMLDRTYEKCGEEAKKLVKAELKTPPPSILRACAHADSLVYFSGNVIDMLKKRRR